jgi:hypothetical protein
VTLFYQREDEEMKDAGMKGAARAYTLEFGAAMLAYMLVLFGSIQLLQAHPQAAWRVPVALAPVVPACFALLAFLRYLARVDELQRRIQLEAIGMSFAAVGLLTFAYGFLEGIGFPHIGLIWILPAMIALWGLGTAIASWRYR